MIATADMIREWNKNGKSFIPSFATLADLSAAVAANGNRYARRRATDPDPI